MGKHAALTLTLCFLLIAISLPAQVSSTDRTVTVTASRAQSVPPDQVTIGIDVFSAPDASRDAVLAALQGSGITVANFSSVYSTTQYDNNGRGKTVLDWTFLVTTPFSNAKSTIDQVTALQTALAKNPNGMTISYSVRGTQASAQALAGQNCAAADLIADARAQAQKIASAAGMSVGSVVGVSGTSVMAPPAGGFSAGTYQPSCTLTVTFALNGV